MNYSRRDLSLLLPSLAAASAAAQNAASPSKTYRFEDLPVRATGPNTARAVFDGKTHTGFAVNLHITELPAGGAPHPPHHHVHEEMIMIHRGDTRSDHLRTQREAGAWFSGVCRFGRRTRVAQRGDYARAVFCSSFGPGEVKLTPSQRATTAVARQLPSTFTDVRAISITASIPSSTAAPSIGS